MTVRLARNFGKAVLPPEEPQVQTAAPTKPQLVIVGVTRKQPLVITDAAPDGELVDRGWAYRKRRLPPGAPGGLAHVAQGIYCPRTADREEIFRLYAIRVAHHFRPHSVLSFSSAVYRKPTLGRVFISGDYQYTTPMFDDPERFLIVQSLGIVRPDDERVQTLQEFSDPMGTFQMAVHTPEVTLLNQFNATKHHGEKHLRPGELAMLIAQVFARTGRGSRTLALAYLETLAQDVDRVAEFRRLVAHLDKTAS